MLQITKRTLKGEKKFVGKVLLYKGESGIQSVKDLYLGKHKSSRELCIIIINTSLTPQLDIVMYSHGELNKEQR